MAPVGSTSANSVLPLIDQAIQTELARLRGHLVLSGPETESLVVGASRALRGGKRLRAQLCVAAAQACGATVESATDPATLAGAALEFFQASALTHDDLMDNSDTRRSEPSAHRWFAQTCASAYGEPAAEAFGSNAAILLGDLLLATSASILAEALMSIPATSAQRANQIYRNMAAEVALGQFLDLIAANAPWSETDDLDRAWRVITAKTARYSVELPLTLGGVLANAPEPTLTWFSGLGRDVGIAFQLRDDLLGVYGDPLVTGKPSGDDLREGKRTVLVALAYREASPADRATLSEQIGRKDLTESDIHRLHEILHNTGATAAVEAEISAHAERALTTLANRPGHVGDTHYLRDLVTAAIHREA